jgi:plasmid stabilization system protein ParE
MTTRPTPKEAAMRLLWLMTRKYGIRPKEIAHQGMFINSFPAGSFQLEDFVPGAEYALSAGWVEPAKMGTIPAVRLTEQGFAVAPDMEPEVETSESRALRLLAAIDARTRNSESPVFVAELAPELEISEQDAQTAWRYLKDKQLIQIFNIPYAARINAQGIDIIDKGKRNPDAPTPGFGSVTYNTINIHHMEKSAIQQAGSHSTQVQTINYGEQDLADLKRAIQVMEENFDQLGLDATATRRARAQIETLKAQLTDEPNPTILKEAGKTLRNITEGVIAGLIATLAEPSNWQLVHDVFARLF